ncbi:hypothetical protein ABE58_06015 [Bacillus safensis]|nr:hypothetical protein [Bacillus safensis]OYN64794.1 hypothetical protein CFH85_14465 [Bacillus safensis]
MSLYRGTPYIFNLNRRGVSLFDFYKCFTSKEIPISLKYKNERLLIFLKELNVFKENIEKRVQLLNVEQQLYE